MASGVGASGGERLVERMIDEGHMVGNHGERHARLLTARDAAISAETTWARIGHLMPRDALRWFRFPGGSATSASIEAVEKLGFAVVGWHVDSADWCYDAGAGGVGTCHPSTFKYVDDDVRDDLAANIIAQARTFQGGITLMHDNRRYTADTLDSIITALAFGGFGFTWLDDDDVFPELNRQARVLRDQVLRRTIT